MLYKDIINPFIIPNRTLQYSTHFYDFQFGGYFAYYQAREEGSEYVNVRVDCEALLSMTRELRVWLKVLVDSIKYYCPLAEKWQTIWWYRSGYIERRQTPFTVYFLAWNLTRFLPGPTGRLCQDEGQQENTNEPFHLEYFYWLLFLISFNWPPRAWESSGGK